MALSQNASRVLQEADPEIEVEVQYVHWVIPLKEKEVLVCTLRGFLGKIWNWPHYMQGKERLKKEAGHSKLVGSRFNKQGHLHQACRGQLQDKHLCTIPLEF